MPTRKPQTTADLARANHVSQRTAQRWLKSGRLAIEGHHTPGGHWRAGRPATLADLPPEVGAAARGLLLKAMQRLAAVLGLNVEEE